MKLLFKQRFFSWLDSYDIYNEAGETVYTVKGELAWGHCLKIYDAAGRELGTVKEKILTWLPKFEMYLGGRYIGSINKEFTFFKPKFNIDCNGWTVDGDWFEWDYTILNAQSQQIASVSKEIWNWTDTYVIDVTKKQTAMFIEQWEKDKYSGIKPGDYDYIWFDFSNMARALIVKQDNQFKLYTQEYDERTGNWESFSGVSVYDSLDAVKRALYYEYAFYCEENVELDEYVDEIYKEE